MGLYGHSNAKPSYLMGSAPRGEQHNRHIGVLAPKRHGYRFHSRVGCISFSALILSSLSRNLITLCSALACHGVGVHKTCLHARHACLKKIACLVKPTGCSNPILALHAQEMAAQDGQQNDCRPEEDDQKEGQAGGQASTQQELNPCVGVMSSAFYPWPSNRFLMRSCVCEGTLAYSWYVRVTIQSFGSVNQS